MSASPLRVGLISAEFPPEPGGIQTYAWEYASALAQHGAEVTVLTQPHPSGEAVGAPFCIAPVLRLRRRLDRQVLRDFPVDVWHALNAAYSWLALEGHRVFVTVHGNDFLQPYQPIARLDLRERLHLPFGSNADRWLGDRLTRWTVRRALPRAAHLFANSHFTMSRLCQELPACADRTSAAMVGVAARWFSKPRPARAPGPTRLLTVCRLAEKHKNVDLVLEALSRLPADVDFHYTVAGDGELRIPLMKRCSELGLDNRVTFAGYVSAEALHELFLASGLFILTTTATSVAYEGFGLVYLEANACGCPVLAARIGGAVEAVQEGVSGAFVEQVTPAGIASALERFLRGELRFDSDACIAFARRFSWKAVADHCLEHYRPIRAKA